VFTTFKLRRDAASDQPVRSRLRTEARRLYKGLLLATLEKWRVNTLHVKL